MKRWLFCLLGLLWSLSVVAQTEAELQTKQTQQRDYTFEELCKKYGSREEFTEIVYGRKMMQMMAESVEEEDKSLAKLLGGIQTIRILSTHQPTAEFERDALSWRNTSMAELVSKIEEGGQVTYTYLNEWPFGLSESTFVLFSFGKKEQVVIYIKGYCSVKDISRLSSIRPK